ncbi:MAG: gamma carbonic anhydrase family protein [Chloroflexi bacterium]|nr:gamma carbonic anhydrase family protein [Chloroflexota bacterium]
MIRSLDGKSPKVHETAFISEAAYVVGDVEIGPYSSVWPGAVIRADMGKTVIGAYTNIQDNCLVHGDADVHIGDHVTLGHSVTCHAARIGDYCLIGNGAVLNDGVEVGDNAIVASGAMVLERKQVPSGSFAVGVPAEVKGRLMERHQEMVRHTAESYVKKGQRYKANGL